MGIKVGRTEKPQVVGIGLQSSPHFLLPSRERRSLEGRETWVED